MAGVKWFSVNVTCAALFGSLLTTIMVNEVPGAFVAAYTLNKFEFALWVAETEIGSNVLLALS